MSRQSIRLTYDLDVGLMARAMTFAGTRVQRRAPLKRKLWVNALAAVLLVVMAAPLLLLESKTGPAGAGLGFIAGAAWITILQARSTRTLAAASTEAAMRRGPVVLTVSEGGISEQSGLGRIDVVWDAVDEIAAIRGATILRLGAMCFVVPDNALPEDLSPDALRIDLAAWQSAAQTFG